MGNCVHRCFGVVDRRRRYLRSKYAEDKDFSIENLYIEEEDTYYIEEDDLDFENLMDEETSRDEMTRLLTDHERQLLNGKQFEALVSEQTRLDAEVDAKLANQERELEREEEAFFEAKREAARIARLERQKEAQARGSPAHNRGWPADTDLDVGEDDFEAFLANVKARSLATRSQVRNGSGDGHSSSSSTAPNRDRTEGSGSLDMEWDHEAGMSPHRRLHPAATVHTSEDSVSKQSVTGSPIHSSDLEWDPEFVSAEDDERAQLVNTAAVKHPVAGR